MSGVVRDFNKGHLNAQAMQVHRKFRFIGQKLFNEAHSHNPAEAKDGWHVLSLNHDVAVMMQVEIVTGTGRKQKKTWKYVWRLGNIVGIRQLKEKPRDTATQLGAAEVAILNPKEISIQDPKAVFTLRWYHESNQHGNVLTGFQNRGCTTWFYLPTSGENYVEPVELVSNLRVIEAVQMQKVLGHVGVWEANADHIKCVKDEFKKLKRNA